MGAFTLSVNSLIIEWELIIVPWLVKKKLLGEYFLNG